MKYTHIGLEDQAKAVNRLPSLPKTELIAPEKLADECLRIVCTSSGAAGQIGSAPVAARHSKGRAPKRANPRRGKVLVAVGQLLSRVDPNCQKVEAAGIEPASPSRNGVRTATLHQFKSVRVCQGCFCNRSLALAA